MGDFDIIETGFSNADETINFGTRTIASESLFEISTLTCFKSEDEIINDVSDIVINTIIKNDHLYFSTGKTLKVFKGENLSELIYNASLGSNIICMAISSDEQLLIMCLETGVVKLLKIDENLEYSSIFSKCLNEETIPQNVYTQDISEVSTCKANFLVVYKNGAVYRVSVKDSHTEEHNFEIEYDELLKLNCTVNITSYLYPFLLTNGSNCNIVNVETCAVISGPTLDIKKVFPLGRKFLYLDFEGKLRKLCSLTLINFLVDYDFLFNNILVLQNERKILAVTKANELGEFFLQLLEKDFQQIFSLKLKHPAHLVDINPTTDDVFFVSYIINNDKNVTELRLQTVYETDPYSRFNRLIRLQRFEEAEHFAKTFNIDPTTVLKAKAQFLVDKTICSSNDINNLINMMDSIDDSYFKQTCCMNVDCSNFEDVRKILYYGSKISPKTGDEKKEDILRQKETMMDQLFRLETFTALTHNNNDIQAFSRFLRCNLLEEVSYCLEHYHIEDAILIYNRMDQVTLRYLNGDYIKKILNIFDKLPQGLYQSFLPTFFPITMTHLPTAMPLFVNWLCNKILYLENREKDNFPENGINMLEGILKLIRIEKHNGLSLQVQCMLNRKGLEELAHLFKGLQNLQKLKKNYGIVIQLNEYLEGPAIFISTLLKVSLPPDLYDDFLKNYLYAFMLHNDVDPDTTLAGEIKSLLQYDDSWMPTIETILRNISSLEIKLQITQEILLNSPMPWCDVTNRISQQALQFSHPLVKEIAAILNNKDRYKVIKNPKYLINEKNLGFEDEFSRVVHRIIYVNEPQMIDDIYHLCKSDDDHSNASYILANHFISKGDLDKALSVIDRNKQNVIYTCAQMIFDDGKMDFEGMFSESQKEFYCKVLPDVYKRLIHNTDKKWAKENHEKYYRLITGVHFFNHNFGTNFTTREFESLAHKKEKYQELLEAVLRSLNFDSLCFNEVLQYSDKIAFYLSLDKEEVLLQLCDKIKKFDILIKAGEYLYENDSSARNLCLMTTLFLKYLGVQDSSMFNSTTYENPHDQTLASFPALVCEDESSENDKFIKGLRLGQKLIAKASTKDFKNQQIQEISNWINSCYDLTRVESTVQDELYPSLYLPKQNVPSSIILRTVQSCYQGFVSSIDPKKDFYSEYYTYFSSNSETQREQPTFDLPSLITSISTFCREGHHITACSLLTTLFNSIRIHLPGEKKLLKHIESLLLDKCVPSLTTAVVGAERIDVELLYNLLVLHRSYKKSLFYYLQVNKRRPKKLNDLSRVGIAFLDFYQETLGRDVMVNSVKLCKWWRRLNPVKSSYEEFFKSDADARLKSLIASETVGMDDILLYCEDFCLEMNEYLKEYLKSCLTNYKPDYEIIKNGDDKGILTMKNDDKILYKKCQDIVNAIKDTKGLFTTLDKMLKEVNFYHYEVFRTIYKLLESNTQSSYFKESEMLTFLKKYTRFNSPSQREKEEWYAAFPDTQILDPLSEFRLPFTQLLFTQDIWSILRPEISLDSYKLWFTPTKILHKNLKVDDICVYAIKQVVSSGILGNCSSKEWIFYSKFDHLFIKIDECVKYITNLERTTSVIYQLMNAIPNGADKVKAAELCLKYAIQYRDQNKNNLEVERAFVKVKNKFYGLSAWHILHRFNLAKDYYLELVAHPKNLIEHLYMDENISKQAGSLSLEYSYINNAVEALAEFFQLDIQKIRLNLLNNWLNTFNNKTDMNASLTYSMSNTSVCQFNNDDNLKRAVYICTSGDRDYWENYLLKIGLDEDEKLEGFEKTMAFRANALKCFSAIADEAKIVQLTSLTFEEFLNYVDKITLLSELESLGISLDIETLNQFNKKELLKRLSHMGKPLAVKCMGAVCITYSLDEDKYWEYIINSSIKLEMISELKLYVEYLKNKSDKRFYVNAWQVIIDKTFQQIVMSTEDLEEMLVNNFLMIQTCPVVFSLNFEKIVETCVNLKKKEYAGLLLQYMPEEKRKKLAKELFENETDFSKMNKLKNQGLWGIHNINYILNRND